MADRFEEFDVDEALGTRAGPPPNEHFRRELFGRTAGILRRRRTLRQAGWFLALAGCYLAGVLSAWLLAGSGEPETATNNVQEAPSAAPSDESPPPSKQAKAAPREAIPPQRKAAPAPPSPYRWLCTLGDQCLKEQGDVEAALAYYGQALRAASKEELAVSYRGDSWLLIRLKQDRNQPQNTLAEGDRT